jgi:hypothetical protein
MGWLKKVGKFIVRIAKNRAVIAAVGAAAGATGNENAAKVVEVVGKIAAAVQ